MRRSEEGARPGSAGFTLIEIIVAVVILAVGVLGFAGTTAYVVRQISLGEVTSKRAMALQTVLERIRSMNYNNLAAGSDSLPPFTMAWTVTPDGSRSTIVQVITTGPGLYSDASNPFPMMRNGVQDTFTYRVIRP